MHENNSSEIQASGLAILLQQDNLLDHESLLNATLAAKQKGMTLVNYLVTTGKLSSHVILNCCIKYFGLPVLSMENFNPEWMTQALIKTELILRYHIIPLNRDDTALYIGVSDPTDHAAFSAISFHTGLMIRLMLMDEMMLDHLIQLHCQPNILYSQVETALAKVHPVTEQTALQEQEENDEPIAELANQILHDAIRKNISDIHFEPFAEYCRIRFRRDGLLYEAATLPTHISLRLLTRLKIMANMNIAERRLPQDGRIQLKTENVDIRMNTCPTIHGEKMVLRILNVRHESVSLDFLGLSDEQKKLFLLQLSQPQGLILVTGPTGSGKTTTLYAALNHLNTTEKNIATVEDPVEIELPGINQININLRIGLDFSVVLRTLLRQDPDVLMVGEIRDRETALIAMQAAQTGHLVLSTLHTNSAIETIYRLQTMGAGGHHLIHSISLIIAQRLVRKLCVRCRKPSCTTPGYNAVGCDACHHGYAGRAGIFEVVPFSHDVGEMILSDASKRAILSQLREDGSKMLSEMGMMKVHEGVTSHAEAISVLGNNEYLQTYLTST